MIKKKAGVLRLLVSTLSLGLKAMVIAAMREVLQIMEPIAFPYAVWDWPTAAAMEDTMTSGIVVPMDTTVAPIRISGI